MISKRSLRLSLIAGAGALALAWGPGAFAGGYYHGYGGYYGGHYYSGYGYGHGHYHKRHRRHHHGGGGKAAAIALGVIGGAIILNEIAEDRARQRAYEARYASRYDRYVRRAPPPYDEWNGDDEFYEDDQAYEDDGQQYENSANAGEDADGLDGALAGGRNDNGPEPIRLDYRQAYQTCIRHARAALRERGFLLAGPARPDTVEDMGRAWKMTANVTAQDRNGASWGRAMYCEADEGRVYLLELI